MNLLTDILTYITQTLGSLFLAMVILRFFLQIARADFYNPFSQGVVRITNPLLNPIRRIVPGIFGIDLASIVLAILVQLLIGLVNFFIVYQSFYNPIPMVLFGVLGTLKITTYLIWVVIIIMVISSFVAPYSSHPIVLLSRQLMDPLVRPIQRLIPPMGGLDFSVLFIGMGNVILQKVLDAAAYSLYLPRPPLTYLVLGY